MTLKRQPVCKGVDSKGELVWGAVPMAHWQTTMMALAVRAAAIMCPRRYTGDFIAFWNKLQLQQERAIELEGENFGGFKSYVLGSEGVKIMEKYKRKHHKGD